MEINFFGSEDYKKTVLELIRKMPRKGFGQFRKIAEYLRISSVLVSQIFKGNRHLTVEQALELSHYFGFSPLEMQYFLTLVQLERSGTHRLKTHLREQLQEIREKSQELKNRVPQDKVLTEEAKAMFYSQWYYSGVRLLSSIEGFQTVDAIAEHLNLPRARIKHIVAFLLDHGLCVESNGRIEMGPRLTHLEASSPLITRHHSNWRMRAMRNMESPDKDELFYSAPMVLSQDDVAWVREQLVELIKRVLERVKPSSSERLACLNIDWFDFRR